jgi:hypothetical protein
MWRRQGLCAFLCIAISASIVFLFRQEDVVQYSLFSEQFSDDSSLGKEGKSIQANSNKKVALLVGGSFQRFLLNSTLHHVFKPLVEIEHHQVDYFLLLTTSAAPPAYRADLTYMNHLRWDPIFGEQAIPSQEEIDTRIRALVDETGANLRSLRLFESMKVNDKRLQLKRQKAKAEHANEDVDLRFPMKDLRPKAIQRTANGNRNMLNLFYGLQLLWQDMVSTEESLGIKYDYVIIFRDDTLWLHDFSLNKLLEMDRSADAFVLSCDARVPRMLPQEINDHAIIVSREKAHVLGKYYTSLFKANLEACAQSVKEAMGTQRGCNSEMILKWILKENSIRVKEVPQSLIPFQRSVNVLKDGHVFPCFHKYCQSQDAPLIADSSVKACKTLAF